MANQGFSTEDRVVDGVRLRLTRAGTDTGRPALLLVHGAPGSGADWTEVMRTLAEHTVCYAPDLAGFGFSERAPGRAGPAGQAALLRTLAVRLGLHRMVVVGYGLGGTVAAHLASLTPRRVSGLVMAAAPLHPRVWPPPYLAPLQVPGIRLLVARRLVAEVPGHGDQAAGLVDLVRGVNMWSSGQAWQKVRRNRPPLLVLWGARDRVYSVGYGRSVAEEAQAAWVSVPDAGHRLPRDQPARMAAEIQRFLYRVSG